MRLLSIMFALSLSVTAHAQEYHPTRFAPNGFSPYYVNKAKRIVLGITGESDSSRPLALSAYRYVGTKMKQIYKTSFPALGQNGGVETQPIHPDGGMVMIQRRGSECTVSEFNTKTGVNYPIATYTGSFSCGNSITYDRAQKRLINFEETNLFDASRPEIIEIYQRTQTIYSNGTETVRTEPAGTSRTLYSLADATSTEGSSVWLSSSDEGIQKALDSIRISGFSSEGTFFSHQTLSWVGVPSPIVENGIDEEDMKLAFKNGRLILSAFSAEYNGRAIFEVDIDTGVATFNEIDRTEESTLKSASLKEVFCKIPYKNLKSSGASQILSNNTSILFKLTNGDIVTNNYVLKPKFIGAKVNYCTQFRTSTPDCKDIFVEPTTGSSLLLSSDKLTEDRACEFRVSLSSGNGGKISNKDITIQNSEFDTFAKLDKNGSTRIRIVVRKSSSSCHAPQLKALSTGNYHPVRTSLWYTGDCV